MLIKEQALLSFLEKCADGSVGAYSEVIVPVPVEGQDGQTKLALFSKDKAFVLDGFRTVDPIKILYYMPREKVLPVETSHKKRIIAGVKACDVKAMQVLDAALAGEDFIDPAYRVWRENTVLISTDCSSTAPTCHCTIVGGHPYADSGFDLNLSKLGDSYIIQTGSEKGEAFLKFLEKNAEVQNSNDADLNAVQSNRKQMTDQVAAQNKDLERSDNYSNLRKDTEENWLAASETCVGCGACTNICPTCYCLILNDETKAQQFVKVRSYDSCQWHGYARVAGGDSPRPKMSQRFRNRYLCKFLFMQSNFNQLGCTGCGRCTEACAGNIDFRKVVKRIMDGVEMAVLEE